jgi:hypothetical protein
MRPWISVWQAEAINPALGVLRARRLVVRSSATRHATALNLLTRFRNQQ